MIVYLLVLSVIIVGASTGTVRCLSMLIDRRSIRVYDAKGYWVVLVLLEAFMIGTLAYFWGVSRFGVPDVEGSSINGAIVGLLFTVCASIVALAIGLVQLKPNAKVIFSLDDK